MPKTFYLATAKDRGEELATLVDTLKSHGWERTYAWNGEDEGGTAQFSDVAVKELKGVADADVLIVLLPGGRGTHVEIGAALALGKPVVIHSPNRDILVKPYPCAFHYHPGVKLLVSEAIDIDAILAAIATRAE
ncbi:MAG TPA: nucleoside 2-deoxyribosyltransferase [Terriglobia bacterium]|nr:nucleoside 2-deoxyribosyltransferase [Terriglobia bacterium]